MRVRLSGASHGERSETMWPMPRTRLSNSCFSTSGVTVVPALVAKADACEPHAGIRDWPPATRCWLMHMQQIHTRVVRGSRPCFAQYAISALPIEPKVYAQV